VSTQVRFLDAALTDVSDAERYYSSQSPALGVEFIDAIEHAISRVRTFPDSGAGYLAGTRRIVLDRFPFSVVYLPGDSEIVVLAIAHQRRAPAYWNDRR